MAGTNPSQLFLLSDHIKLSLLERQRAISLNLSPNSQDSQISRSLDTLQSGIAALEAQSQALDDPLQPTVDRAQIAQLKAQFTDLSAQFTGHSTPGSSASLTKPNDPALQRDFTAAAQHSQSLKNSKSVRFTDSPSPPPATAASAAADANRNALFPYRDDPNEDEDGLPDHSELNNEQIHTYHQSVIAEQDDQLDRLGMSIGRQREISIAIGDELDDHAMLLDDVDSRVDRHQGQLDGAGRRLAGVARKAKENWSMTTIIVLIVVLVLLIVITK